MSQLIHTQTAPNKDVLYTKMEDHYRKNSNKLCKVLHFRCGSNAEEVVQEAYTRALTYWRAYDEGQEFEQWFSTILQNCVKDNMRTEALRGMTEELLIDEPAMPHIEHHVLLSQIMDHVADKPTNVAHILRLFLVEGYTSQEIEKVVPEKADGIRQIVSRFRKDIQEGVIGEARNV